jgi:hypothetical protein
MIKKEKNRITLFGVKLKPIALLGVFLIMDTLGTSIYAQSIVPQSVNSGGTKMSNPNGSLSFIVGDLVVLSQIDSQGNTLGGGFTAGASLTTMDVKETDASVLNVKVYPNPTTELVNIQINHSTIDQVVVTVTDLEGNEVYSGKYVGIANIIGINTSSYAIGSYLLTLKNTSDQVLGTYKIIKH